MSTSIPPALEIPRRLLLGPGPSDADPRVLKAMSAPLLGHLDPKFVAIMAEVQEMLRQVFRTKNRLTLPISATGMAGMETCLTNLVEPGDKVLVFNAGYFATRMVDVAGRAGAEVHEIKLPWGQAFSPEQMRKEIDRVGPKVVGVVHAETSTGVLQSLEGLGEHCKKHGALLVIDTVTSLGCVPLELDAWGVDAAFSCSQKGLACPPGLSPLSFSDRALEKLQARKSKVQSWYFDLSIITQYWTQGPGARAYHHTAPISANYALHEGLRIVLQEGLEARWKRHQTNHLALKAGLEAMGMQYVAPEGHRLPQLNAVYFPQGVEDLPIRKRMLEEFGIEIGGGLGELAGKIWRIGLMGCNSRADVVYTCLSTLERCLIDVGVKIVPGTGVGAAEAEHARMAKS
jgi:alanine-glyoxylate transaminase/serine-glyoxylate transaminase/serine-pyruvate transaminase